MILTTDADYYRYLKDATGRPARPAPRGSGRAEGLAFLQLEIAVNNYVEWGVRWALTSGLRILLIGGGLALALWALRGATGRLRALLEGVAPSPEQAKRATTLTNVVHHVAVAAVSCVAVMMGLAELGVDVKPVLASAGWPSASARRAWSRT